MPFGTDKSRRGVDEISLCSCNLDGVVSKSPAQQSSGELRAATTVGIWRFRVLGQQIFLVFFRETLPQQVAQVVTKDLEGLLSCGRYRDICHSKPITLTSEVNSSHSQSSSTSLIPPAEMTICALYIRTLRPREIDHASA